MTKVYLAASSSELHRTAIHGVFSTREKATEALQSLQVVLPDGVPLTKHIIEVTVDGLYSAGVSGELI